jgi:hypothetical protein
MRHYTYAGDIAEGIYKTIETLWINEDFNLNLKVDTEDKNFAMRIREYLMSKKELPNIIDVAKGVSRFYKQETFVIYEWDINLLDNPNRMDLVCERLARTLEAVCKVLL